MIHLPRSLHALWLVPLLVASASAQAGQVVEYALTVSETLRSPAGKEVKGLVLNGDSPGPVLRFTEGDTARITVHNGLEDEQASLHWHGLLLPNAMDGVPYLTTPPIPPGGQQVYEFPLRQSGTYWYHSHTGLQEQRGVYGAIVIEPREVSRSWDREHVVVLSDWTNENPNEVMRTLMRGSEWYALKKGNIQSLLGAWRAGELGEFMDRERQRMPPMDISDVAYDAFLVNGKREITLDAKPGERVLMRVVNAGASTYFHLSYAAGPMTIVASDGMPVVPVEVKRLLMGMAETYDVVVTMPEEAEAIEFRATAHDGSGHGSVWLGQGERRTAEELPKPNVYTMDEMVQAGLSSVNPERGKRAATAERPFNPYALLRSPVPTTVVRSEDTVRKLTMRLTGDMTRYLWGFDGETLSESSAVRVKQNEVLRIEFVNDTMMHHPLHLHGHFFRVLNGHGEYSPLKHTVDVPPMGKATIEWIADEESGDWFFHCHMLYHMDAGMARIFTYNQDPDYEPTVDPKMINPAFIFVDASLSTNMSMGSLMLMKGRNDYFANWETSREEEEAGEGYESEIDIGWSRYWNPNLHTLVGYRITDIEDADERFFAGICYRAPYLIHSTLTLDSQGDVRIEFEKDYQLTDRLSISAEFEYDTLLRIEWASQLAWTLSKRFDLIGNYHSDYGYGIGLSAHF